MKNRKYSLVFIMLLCMIMAVSAFPMTANADRYGTEGLCSDSV